MKKTWQNSNYTDNFIPYPKEQNTNQLLDLYQTFKSTSFMVSSLKEELLDGNYPDFIEYLSQVFDDLNETDRLALGQFILENSDFTSVEAIEQEVRHYQFFTRALQQKRKYLAISSIEKNIEELNDETQPLDVSALYLLVKYCQANKIKSKDYFEKDKHGNLINAIIDAYFSNDRRALLKIAIQMKEDEDHLLFELQEKKVNKLIEKSQKRIMQLQNNQSSDLVEKVKNIRTDVLFRLKQMITQEAFHLFPKVDEFIELCQNMIGDENEVEELEETCEDEVIFDLSLIQDVLVESIFLLRQEVIEKEVISHQEINDFYELYQNTSNDLDAQKIIMQLENLIDNINDSPLKNTESLRNLQSIIYKDIEDYKTRSFPEVVEEVKPEIKEQHTPTIQIGKYTVIADSKQKNPVDLQKLLVLLDPKSRQYVKDLERLIFQIGYDKVHSYLIKAPMLYIQDLEAIIRIDRQLRFEYQRILEDIEMYFRSSLTYYLTNKYDYTYQILFSHRLFYRRSYLMNNLFVNSDEHYNHIGQLNERIDMEIKNNNRQVIDEYAKYKYSLPFSTAAGIMSFGWIMALFDNLNYTDKIEFLHTYYTGITPHVFSNWMNSLTNLRNRCAHYQSLYRISNSRELRLIMTLTEDQKIYHVGTMSPSLFYYTIVMARLSPDPFNIEDFIDNLGVVFRKASRENYMFNLTEDYAFPNDWREILEREKNKNIPRKI